MLLINQYPYITLFYKFSNQYILEGCLENKNFKVLIKYDELFDEYNISYQFTSSNLKDKKYNIYELFFEGLLDYELVLKISKRLLIENNK